MPMSTSDNDSSSLSRRSSASNRSTGGSGSLSSGHQQAARAPNKGMALATMLAVILPLSLSFWILSFFAAPNDSDLPSPIRWFVAIFVPILVTGWGYGRRSLDLSGCLTALTVGFVLTLSNYCFFSCLLAFFISSSKATKYKSSMKRKFESDHKEGGQRNWAQVICNGGIATEFALIYMVERGIAGEIPINFPLDYNSSWLAIGVLGSLACANGDTYASELGSVLARSQPRLITTLERVPRGTNGGVTPIGLIVSAFGGLVIGLTYYVTLLFCINRDVISASPPQWPVILIGLIGGLLGSVIDSVLGATLQYSGLNTKTGHVVEAPGDRVEYISGVSILDNHSVNLLSTLITAITLPNIASLIWWFV